MSHVTNVLAISAGGVKIVNVMGELLKIDSDLTFLRHFTHVVGTSAGALSGLCVALLPLGPHTEDIIDQWNLAHSSFIAKLWKMIIGKDIITQDDIGNHLIDTVQKILGCPIGTLTKTSTQQIHLKRFFAVGFMEHHNGQHSYHEKAWNAGYVRWDELYRYCVSSASIAGLTTAHYHMSDGGESFAFPKQTVKTILQQHRANLFILSANSFQELNLPEDFPTGGLFDWIPFKIRQFGAALISPLAIHVHEDLHQFFDDEKNTTTHTDEHARITTSKNKRIHLLQPRHTLTNGIYTCNDHELKAMQQYALVIANYMSQFFKSSSPSILF